MADWFCDALRDHRQRMAGVVAEPEAEPEETFPDLGQGARGPLPAAAGPSMSDVIRGSLSAQRELVHDHIDHERRLRIPVTRRIQ